MKTFTEKEKEIIGNAYHALGYFMSCTSWNGPSFESNKKRVMKAWSHVPAGTSRYALLLHHLKSFVKDRKFSAYTSIDRDLVLCALDFCADWHRYKNSDTMHISKSVKEIKKAFNLLNKINVFDYV